MNLNTRMISHQITKDLSLVCNLPYSLWRFLYQWFFMTLFLFLVSLFLISDYLLVIVCISLWPFFPFGHDILFAYCLHHGSIIISNFNCVDNLILHLQFVSSAVCRTIYDSIINCINKCKCVTNFNLMSVK